MPPSTAETSRARKVLARLRKEYGEPYCFLDGSEDPFRLLTAVILSAQCTDAQVNRVTPALFAKYPTPEALANAPRGEVEKLVFATGFYRNKARNIQEMAAALLERHGGKVPSAMGDLVALPGVGRKTANVVQAQCFGVSEGVCVDTHVARLAYRLGFSRHEGDATRIERDLMALFPTKDWDALSFHLISHGRAVCDAKRPECGRCPVAALCPKRGVLRASAGTRGSPGPRSPSRGASRRGGAPR